MTVNIVQGLVIFSPYRSATTGTRPSISPRPSPSSSASTSWRLRRAIADAVALDRRRPHVRAHALATLLAVADRGVWGIVIGFGNAVILWASGVGRIHAS